MPRQKFCSVTGCLSTTESVKREQETFLAEKCARCGNCKRPCRCPAPDIYTTRKETKAKFDAWCAAIGLKDPGYYVNVCYKHFSAGCPMRNAPNPDIVTPIWEKHVRERLRMNDKSNNNNATASAAAASTSSNIPTKIVVPGRGDKRNFILKTGKTTTNFVTTTNAAGLIPGKGNTTTTSATDRKRVLIRDSHSAIDGLDATAQYKILRLDGLDNIEDNNSLNNPTKCPTPSNFVAITASSSSISPGNNNNVMKENNSKSLPLSSAERRSSLTGSTGSGISGSSSSGESFSSEEVNSSKKLDIDKILKIVTTNSPPTRRAPLYPSIKSMSDEASSTSSSRSTDSNDSGGCGGGTSTSNYAPILRRQLLKNSNSDENSSTSDDNKNEENSEGKQPLPDNIRKLVSDLMAKKENEQDELKQRHKLREINNSPPALPIQVKPPPPTTPQRSIVLQATSYNNPSETTKVLISTDQLKRISPTDPSVRLQPNQRRIVVTEPAAVAAILSAAPSTVITSAGSSMAETLTFTLQQPTTQLPSQPRPLPPLQPSTNNHHPQPLIIKTASNIVSPKLTVIAPTTPTTVIANASPPPPLTRTTTLIQPVLTTPPSPSMVKHETISKILSLEPLPLNSLVFAPPNTTVASSSSISTSEKSLSNSSAAVLQTSSSSSSSASSPLTTSIDPSTQSTFLLDHDQQQQTKKQQQHHEHKSLLQTQTLSSTEAAATLEDFESRKQCLIDLPPLSASVLAAVANDLDDGNKSSVMSPLCVSLPKKPLPLSLITSSAMTPSPVSAINATINNNPENLTHPDHLLSNVSLCSTITQPLSGGGLELLKRTPYPQDELSLELAAAAASASTSTVSAIIDASVAPSTSATSVLDLQQLSRTIVEIKDDVIMDSSRNDDLRQLLDQSEDPCLNEGHEGATLTTTPSAAAAAMTSIGSFNTVSNNNIPCLTILPGSNGTNVGFCSNSTAQNGNVGFILNSFLDQDLDAVQKWLDLCDAT